MLRAASCATGMRVPVAVILDSLAQGEKHSADRSGHVEPQITGTLRGSWQAPAGATPKKVPSVATLKLAANLSSSVFICGYDSARAHVEALPIYGEGSRER
jgi:hypothetical protein